MGQARGTEMNGNFGDTWTERKWVKVERQLKRGRGKGETAGESGNVADVKRLRTLEEVRTTKGREKS